MGIGTGENSEFRLNAAQMRHKYNVGRSAQRILVVLKSVPRICV